MRRRRVGAVRRRVRAVRGRRRVGAVRRVRAVRRRGSEEEEEEEQQLRKSKLSQEVSGPLRIVKSPNLYFTFT